MDILPLHQKYGYSAPEQIIMVFVTGITNFGGIPACILLYRTNHIFETHMGFFTVFTSFMYHSLESIDGYLYLNEGEWHRLDNIGAITGFMMLFISLMDNRDSKLDLNLYMISLIIAILAQEKAPWNLFYTLVPICMSLISFLIVLSFRKRRPSLNRNMLGKAMFWLFLASINFGLGLDEFKDYLRIFHGLWHLCLGISSFYFWQVKIRPGHEFSFNDFWKKQYTPDMQISFARD